MDQTPRPKRKYEPIWDLLKSTGSCTISAPRPLHSRIYKAVVKEKYNDLGYKVLLAETSQKALITHKRVGSTITFYLTKSIGTEDI
jgi:hypothetical protein